MLTSFLFLFELCPAPLWTIPVAIYFFFLLHHTEHPGFHPDETLCQPTELQICKPCPSVADWKAVTHKIPWLNHDVIWGDRYPNCFLLASLLRGDQELPVKSCAITYTQWLLLVSPLPSGTLYVPCINPSSHLRWQLSKSHPLAGG